MPSKNQLTGLTIPCDNCGKEFYITKYRYNHSKTHCCSVKCAFELRTKLSIDERTCEYCGKTFTCRKKLPQRFCSTQCQNEWQKTNVGERNPKYKRTMLPCECCGKLIPVEDHKIKDGRHHFCDAKCRQEWFANVWSQQDWWVEESRKRGAKTSAVQIGKTMTKPQLIVNAILDDLQIQYVNEKPFVYYAIDNYLSDQNLVIEVMGDYWHSSPIKYRQHELSDSQKKVVSRDKAKRTYLKNNYGIPILYLWESDIYKNKNMCELLIQEYIQSGGNLLNYNSFNYSIDEFGKLCLNQNIIIPFQEYQNKGA